MKNEKLQVGYKGTGLVFLLELEKILIDYLIQAAKIYVELLSPLSICAEFQVFLL